MKLPDRRYALANGIILEPREIPAAVWSEHVLKHPLGINWDAQPGAWNVERWDALEPPVVTASERDALLSAIAGLVKYEGKCEVDEVQGRKRRAKSMQLPCKSCPSRLAEACAVETSDRHPIGQRYAAVTHALLDALLDAAVVPKDALKGALMQCFPRNHAALTTVIIMSIGKPKNDVGGKRQVARVIRGDGVTSEFTLRGMQGEWRTTYRRPPLGANSTLSHLLSVAPPVKNEPLSENCLVPRLWWESHGQR